MREIYNDKNYFFSEKKYILENSWFLIGTKNEFKKKNDFIKYKLFNIEIIIYFFGQSTFRVFENYCPHRGSALKDENRGNSPLICPYHFWSYDTDGKLKSVPLKNKVLNNDQCNKIQLTQWEIDFAGNFIFVKSYRNKINLKKYLGEKYELLEKISKKFGSFIKKQSWVWNLNWKIAVENSLDEYHAIYAHQTTFKKTLSLNPHYEKSKNIYLMQTPIKNEITNKLKKYENFLPKELFKKYTHFHLFPLNSISTSHGLIFFVQSYIPINHKKTLVESSVYFNQKLENKISDSIKNYLSQSALEFNEKVFLEDEILCDKVQRGYDSDFEFSAIYGNFEKRINFFIDKINSIHNK